MDSHRSQSRLINGILIAVFIGSATLTVIALRANSQTSQRLYEALLEADQSGENVEESLDELRTYIYSHMNTEIGSENGIHPPIQLQGTYSRLVSEEQERVDKINDTVYETAQSQCEQQFGAGSLRDGRVQCVEKYIEQNSVEVSEAVSPDLYRFDFESPIWSPDLAGYSLLVAVVVGLILCLRAISALLRKVLT